MAARGRNIEYVQYSALCAEAARTDEEGKFQQP